MMRASYQIRSTAGSFFLISMIMAYPLIAENLDNATDKFLYKERPVLLHSLENEDIDDLKTSVVGILSLSDAELLSIIPKQTPLLRVGCPHCRKNETYDRAWDGHILSRSMNYSWDPRKPNQIQCKDCQRTYPGSKDYELRNTDIIYNGKGDAIEVRYYFDSEKFNFRKDRQKETLGRKYYLEAAIDYAKWEWIEPQLHSLSKLFFLTGDERYAHKAILALSEYAKNYPNYLFTTGGQSYVSTKDMKFPYGYIDTRAGRDSGGEMMPELIYVIDRLYTSKSMDLLSHRLDRNIRNDLWEMYQLGLLRTFAKGYNEIIRPHSGKYLLNIAKIFDRVDIAHLVYQAFFDFPRLRFSADGHYGGGTGYHQIQAIIIGMIRDFDPISDPVAYKGEDRIDNVSHWFSREEFWRDVFINARRDIRYPDGNMPITGATSSFPHIWGSGGPRERSTNVLRPSYKYAVLGDGKKEQQVQVHMKFGTNDGGHSHEDSLSFQLFAHGHPLTDSYTRNRGILAGIVRPSIFKNTVIVDYSSQSRARSDANPLIFENNLPGLSVISVDAKEVYRETGTSQYKRTLALNTIDNETPYVIDIFQVKGGKRHDYIMKSSTYFPSTASTNAPMKMMKGLRPLLPTHLDTSMDEDPVISKNKINDVKNIYGLFYDVKKAPANQNLYIDYKLNEPWKMEQKEGKDGKWEHTMRYVPHLYSEDSWADRGNVGVRHHILGHQEQEIFLADIPSLHEEGWRGNNSKPSYEWERIPCFVLRHDPKDDQHETMFVLIHEPYYKRTSIKSYQQIDVGNPDALALKIECGERSDVFIYSRTGKPISVNSHGISFEGTIGLVATNRNTQSDAYLIAGKSLLVPKEKLSLSNRQPLYKGQVQSSTRRWDNLHDDHSFIVESELDLPAGDTLRGQHVILTHNGGYLTYAKDRLDLWKLDVKGGINSFGLNPRALWERWYKDSAGPNPELTFQVDTEVSHAFEISRIEKVNGKSVIHVNRDHGLIIRDGKAKEFFFPMREFKGKTTFEIKTSVGTQMNAIVSPPGAHFLDSAKVSCRTFSQDHKLLYALTPPSKKPKESDWRDYREELIIKENVDLHVKIAADKSIRKAEFKTYEFRNALIAPPKPPGLVSGLIQKTWIGDHRSVKPKLKQVRNINPKSFIKSVGEKGDGKLAYEGFIRIDKPGTYTFHYLADRDGILKIGDKILSDLDDYGQARPISRMVKAALKPGVYPFYCDLVSFEKPIHGAVRWPPDVRLDWEGPGFGRTAVPASQFLRRGE